LKILSKWISLYS